MYTSKILRYDGLIVQYYLMRVRYHTLKYPRVSMKIKAAPDNRGCNED